MLAGGQVLPITGDSNLPSHGLLLKLLPGLEGTFVV